MTNTDMSASGVPITVSPDMIGQMFPHLSADECATAVDLFTAAQPFKNALAKIDRADIRTMVLQQWSQVVIQAVNMIGQK